jgi:hypothetical protein
MGIKWKEVNRPQFREGDEAGVGVKLIPGIAYCNQKIK